MPRILAIDFGQKRTGLAATDPLKIIATGLCTVQTKNLMQWLKDYFAKEAVELVIIGDPKNLDDTDTHATKLVQYFIEAFKKEFPLMPIIGVDERNTSKMAKQSMLDMGMKKKERRNKAFIDEIAATIILQNYMQEMGI
jgi:putative holliday junction resolvase